MFGALQVSYQPSTSTSSSTERECSRCCRTWWWTQTSHQGNGRKMSAWRRLEMYATLQGRRTKCPTSWSMEWFWRFRTTAETWKWEFVVKEGKMSGRLKFPLVWFISCFDLQPESGSMDHPWDSAKKRNWIIKKDLDQLLNTIVPDWVNNICAIVGKTMAIMYHNNVVYTHKSNLKMI